MMMDNPIATPFNMNSEPRKKKSTDNIKTVGSDKKTIQKRPELTEEQVSSISFFKEDLDALDEEVYEADKLYAEIHGLYTQLTNSEYVPSKNLRDIAEIAKNMVSVRSYHSDTLNKRIALKKLIVDMNYRNNGGIDENGQEAIQATARQIVAMVRQESFNQQPQKQVSDKRTSEGKKRAKEEEMLDSVVQNRINSGEITMGVNDMLVGTSEYVVTRYDKEQEKFVAVDSRSGKVIDNFPAERLPSGKISKISENSATLISGDEIKLYNSMEFDDEYVDEGD